jgi:hypothetical protein
MNAHVVVLIILYCIVTEWYGFVHYRIVVLTDALRILQTCHNQTEV